MKKKILSVLLGCFLLVGTVFANAVSIEFEDLTTSHIDEDASIIYEEVNINENNFSSEATKNIENNIEDDKSISSKNMIGYFTKAENITYIGEDEINTNINNGNKYICYNNSSASDLKYVVYSNAVIAGKQKYDLVIYPFKVTTNATIPIIENNYYPSLYVYPIDGYAGYKLCITEHRNRNKSIDLKVLFGIGDLDNTEFIALPSNFTLVHQGINVFSSDFMNGYTKYIGTINSPNDDNDTKYNTNCVMGECFISRSGMMVFYGGHKGLGAPLAFDSIKNYIDNNAYTIEFNLNNGTANIPTSIIKFGDNISTIMGNIENVIPTRIGCTFKGWSAVPQLNEKRIAYDIGNTGAIQTSSSWTYEDYCNYTGGNSSNRTLTLYAQWEANQYSVTYIDIDANGNEIGRTTQSADYDIFVKGSDIGGDKTDNAYYNQYKYVSDTSAKVTTDGATVYRIFKFCETEAKANLQWNDNNNADGFRPDKYKLKLKQNGKVIDEIELSSDETNYTFPNLPKYDSNGNAYKYTFDVDASNRYQIVFDEDGNLIVEDYLPANFSVTIPKTIVLDGNTGNADYAVSVNGTFYYNDTLTVIPESSLTLTDRSKISSMQADISQQKTVFMKEDGVASGTSANGSIQVDRSNFAGIWKGHFNFDIKFKMQN